MGLSKKYQVILFLTPVCIVCDQVSKSMVREKVAPLMSIDVISKFLQLEYAENPGIILGMFANLSPALRIPLFSAIALVAIAIIAYLFRQAPGNALRLPAALSFVLSGAMGNMIDRLRWGVVVDFIKVQVWPPANYYWPNFNFADIFIGVGIGLLILDSLLSGRIDDETEPEGGGNKTS